MRTFYYRTPIIVKSSVVRVYFFSLLFIKNKDFASAAALQMTRDEELEYDSKAKIDKLQDNVKLQNFNKEGANNE